MTLQNNFLFSVSSSDTHLSSFFTFPICFKCQNDHRMIDVEFFGNFSCSFKRISFNKGSQLVTVNFRWLATTLLIFKALVFSAKLLESALHYTFVSSSCANCVVDDASCLCCLMNRLNSSKKNA